MAGVEFSVEAEISNMQVGESGSETLTILQVQAKKARLLLRELSVTLKDADFNGGEVEVQLVRQTTAGSAFDPVTPNKLTPGQETITATAIRGKSTGTSEPTTTDILMRKWIPRAGGEFFWTAIRERDKVPVQGKNDEDGERIGLRVITDANTHVTSHMILEE